MQHIGQACSGHVGPTTAQRERPQGVHVRNRAVGAWGSTRYVDRLEADEWAPVLRIVPYGAVSEGWRGYRGVKLRHIANEVRRHNQIGGKKGAELAAALQQGR